MNEYLYMYYVRIAVEIWKLSVR